MHLPTTFQSCEQSQRPEAKSERRSKRKTFDDYEFVVDERRKVKTSDLGVGAYGTVKRVRDKATGELYAMKILNKQSIFRSSSKENLKREISIQKSIQHPHIITLQNYFEDSENVYIILEYAENGSLFEYIRRRKRCSENEAFVYFFQTALGLDYLHKRSVIHRDLKPENLLLDKDGNVKLCDFGWSAESHDQRVTFCGTIDYMAPEMIKNQPHDYRIDIWSLGVLLYELLHGNAPFAGKTDKEKCQNIARNSTIKFDPSLSNEACDLIKSILKPDPSQRLSMTEIFNHTWMKKYEDVFKIDIRSYVDQQDVEVREVSILDDSRIETSPKNSLTELGSARGKRSASGERGQSRKNSLERDTKKKTSLVIKGEKLDMNMSRGNFESSTKISSLISNLYLRSTGEISTKESDTNSRPGSGVLNFHQHLGSDTQRKNQPIRALPPRPDTSSGANQQQIIKNETSKFRFGAHRKDENLVNDYREGKDDAHLPNKEIDRTRRNRSVDREYISEMYARKHNSDHQNFCNSAEKPKNSSDPKAFASLYQRNLEIEKQLRERTDSKKLNFFEKLLVGIGCITRDNRKIKDFD